jgi:hypothetical protein
VKRGKGRDSVKEPTLNFDDVVKGRVHPSIPQGERFEMSVSARFSVRGEVSNHERKGAVGLLTKLSTLLGGKNEKDWSHDKCLRSVLLFIGR